MFLEGFALCLSNPVALGDGTANEYMKDRITLICSKLILGCIGLGDENAEVVYYRCVKD